MKKELQRVRRFNSVHRQQLFYWTGKDFDDPARNQTAADRLSVRIDYVNRLKSILSDGIWLKVPDQPDQLGDGHLIKVTRPVACFTEWALGQSLAHTSEYGRLGLGFSKRFILSKGGQPVIYVSDAEKGARYVSALCSIARALGDKGNKIPRSIRESLKSDFAFISHFVKPIQRRRKPTTPSLPDSRNKSYGSYGSTKQALRGLIELALSEDEKRFTRKYGRFLHYLEEREWRVVFDEALQKHFRSGPGAPAGPDYYLPVKGTDELFTVVVPDHLTVNLVMKDDDLREILFPKDGLPVTLLSLLDVGTF